MFLTAIIQNLPYMAIIVPVLLAIGLILCFAEAIIPGFGVCGVLGILMLVGGTVYFTLGINEFYWVIVLVLGLIIGLVLIFKVFVRSAKKGRLGKTPIFDTKTNLPVDYDLSGMMSNAKYATQKALDLRQFRKKAITSQAKTSKISAVLVMAVELVPLNKVRAN